MLLRSVITALLSASAAFAAPELELERRNLDSFIQAERARSLRGVLANIGTKGALSSGASSGTVIKSPSTSDPDYLYTWVRDAALAMKMIIDELVAGDWSLEPTVIDYYRAQAVLQTVSNPSGSFSSGLGLGEPKFEIMGQRFNGNWARPERDGPALRATALMGYVEWLIERGQWHTARKVVWPIIINDLNYIGQYWNQTGFDLWEEVKGSSFFTIQVQHRALVQGSQTAQRLSSFWNGTSLIANINTAAVRSGRDSNTLLGPIATFDVTASCSDGSLQPCSSKVLASHKVLVDSFRPLYPINALKVPGTAAAVGRYPEDIYFGGNPWYLCTLAAAEVLYDAVAQFRQQKALTVDDISLPFFRDLYPVVQRQTYRSGSPGFQAITRAMTQYADGFVGIVQQYLPPNGSISEQFSGSSGQPMSAYDLTWSFTSFVTMAERRSGYFPCSWGANSEGQVPATCGTTTVTGTYVPATAAGAPNGSSTSCTISTTFNVNSTTYFGENMYVLGNTSALGAYDPTNADGMSSANYSSARPLWNLTLSLPANEAVQYQYIRQESNGSYTFDAYNRTLVIPACGQPGPVTNDAWGGAGPE